MKIPAIYIKNGKLEIYNVLATQNAAYVVCMYNDKRDCNCKHRIPHIWEEPLRKCTAVICAKCENQSYRAQGCCTPCEIQIFGENFIPIGSINFRWEG